MNWNQNHNDPYGSNPYGNPPGGYPSEPHNQRPRSSLMWLWLLLGGGGLSVLVCCGACCGLAYVGMSEEDREIQAMFEHHEMVVEHIGDVQSVERDWSKSLEEEDDDIWYFRIEGDKGDGHIVVKEVGFDVLELEWARLETDNGETFEIYP